MPDLTTRSTQAELMDDPAAPEKELRQNLRELEVINRLLGGYRVILNALQSLQLTQPVTIMDIGSGGGDTLRAIARWAQKKGKVVSLTGIDYNPVMTAYAMEQPAPCSIEYRTQNIYDDALLETRPDIITCSLFCHHFEDTALITLLKRMQQLAGHAVIINDLHRHWFAYHAISIITAVCSKTYMVKHDARLSVARAFKRRELEQLLQAAGIQQYRIRWRWAWRWEVIIEH